MKTAHWLRVLISFDQLLQCFRRHGTPGITISSWIGMSAARGKRAGLFGQWLLEESWPLRWIFGKNHCRRAVMHDRERAREVARQMMTPEILHWLNGNPALTVFAKK